MKQKTKQINNLKIKYSEFYEKWQVITPSKTVIEEFANKSDAEDFASRTFSYLKKNFKWLHN